MVCVRKIEATKGYQAGVSQERTPFEWWVKRRNAFFFSSPWCYCWGCPAELEWRLTTISGAALSSDRQTHTQHTKQTLFFIFTEDQITRPITTPDESDTERKISRVKKFHTQVQYETALEQELQTFITYQHDCWAQASHWCKQVLKSWMWQNAAIAMCLNSLNSLKLKWQRPLGTLVIRCGYRAPKSGWRMDQLNLGLPCCFPSNNQSVFCASTLPNFKNSSGRDR